MCLNSIELPLGESLASTYFEGRLLDLVRSQKRTVRSMFGQPVFCAKLRQHTHNDSCFKPVTKDLCLEPNESFGVNDKNTDCKCQGDVHLT